MKLRDILRLIRPHQWTKNLFIILPLFFNANIANIHQLILCIYAFAGFSFIASAIYCVNDILDVEEDRLHPEKSGRPLASGSVSLLTARLSGLLLFTGGLSVLITTRLNTGVIIMTLLYFVMNMAYVFKLKQIAIIDILCIALGFVLRVLIGGYAAGVTLSHWIILMTFLLALFLACSKRRDDVLHYQKKGIIARKNIVRYNVDFLNAMMIITATITIISYIMYSVDSSVVTRLNNNYIYTTSLFVLAAIFRYLQIAMVEENSGSPTKILLKDRFVQICIAGWILAFAFIIYF